MTRMARTVNAWLAGSHIRQTQFVRGNYQTDSSEIINTLSSLLFIAKFSSTCRQFKNHIKLFSNFYDESRNSQILKKRSVKNPVNNIPIVYFRYAR